MSTQSNLDDAIDAWVSRELRSGCARLPADRIDELKDHMLCVAEARMSSGDSVEQAVAFAVAQFGDVEQVRRQLLGRRWSFLRWLSHLECAKGAQKRRSDRYMVVTSVLFAASMLIAAWLMKDREAYTQLWMLLIGAWVVVAFSQGGARETARAEWRWFKRLLER